jgi:hypothetical protein
MYDGHSDPK